LYIFADAKITSEMTAQMHNDRGIYRANVNICCCRASHLDTYHYTVCAIRKAEDKKENGIKQINPNAGIIMYTPLVRSANSRKVTGTAATTTTTLTGPHFTPNASKLCR
jgi:hypothetical protein